MINYIASIIDILNIMGQEKKNSSSGGSSLCSCVELIVFLVILTAIQIPMIYLAGSDVAHTDDPHPLDHVFDNEEHKNVLEKLTKSKNKYMIVQGQPDSGVITFMKHFASQQKNDRTVLVRNYVEDPYEQAYIVFRYAKTLIEDQLDLEDDTPKVWILFGFDMQVPHQDIDEIKNNGNDDRIIIVSRDKIKIKGFKNVKFPPISVEDLQQTLVDKMQVDEDQAQVLTYHYGNIPDIFINLNLQTYSDEEHLGDYHKSVDELNEEESQLVQGLCENGEQSGEGTEMLSAVGVVEHENKLYWVNDKARLNYELKTVSFCQDTVVPDDILKMIYEAEENAANDELTIASEEQSSEEQQGQQEQGQEQEGQYEEQEVIEQQAQEEQLVESQEGQQEEQVEESEEEEVIEEQEEMTEEEEQEKPKKKSKKMKEEKRKNTDYEEEQEKPNKKSKKEKHNEDNKKGKKEKKEKKGKKSKRHEDQL